MLHSGGSSLKIEFFKKNRFIQLIRVENKVTGGIDRAFFFIRAFREPPSFFLDY
jgi:hypothetical protein